MCHVCYNQCRFCEREDITCVDLCVAGKTGNICIDRSVLAETIHHLIDEASGTLRAAVALPQFRKRFTCSDCEELTIHVISITPIRIATEDIYKRPAFSWLCHYYCPVLLDAIYTAAQLSLIDLQERLTSGIALLQWHSRPEDFERSNTNLLDDSTTSITSTSAMFVRIHTVGREEHEEHLSEGGEMGKALLSQEKRERQQLHELIVLRRYLRERLDARQMMEYKVVCDPDQSPIEHVRVASIVAATGGTLCRGTRLREVATRVSEWERYFDVALSLEKRRSHEPELNARLLWVDRGYGRRHPSRIQEIARLARRQRLEQ